LTKARHVSGLFVFPEMRSDGRGSAISRRGFSCDDVVTSGARICCRLDAMQCPIPHRSVRKNLHRREPVERIFFSPYFLPSQNRAARFSPSADVITFFGLIHLKQAKIRLSQRSK
jgi:hypothetical protein